MSEKDSSGGKMKSVGSTLYDRVGPSVYSILLNILIFAFCIILVAEVAFNSVYIGIYVVNISMQPTVFGAENENVSGGDFIYVNKWVAPDYGDVVVVSRETVGADGVSVKGNIIKRAVAFGGDTVEIVMGELFVNGEPVDEPYIDPNRNDPFLNNFSEHTVAEGCMFLLGDNRNHSTDSRENGDYPLNSLVGVVPDWSLNCKGFTTAIYTFFNFTLKGK